MNVPFFAYTRTYQTDFHVLYQPKGPEEIISEIARKAEELVGCYDINNRRQPQWVCLKSDEVLFWGIVCANSSLGENYKDAYGREVRGCFGVILDCTIQTSERLPYDIDVFSTLYKKTIDTIWENITYESFEYNIDLEVLHPKSTTSYDNLLEQNGSKSDIIIVDISADSVDITNEELNADEGFENSGFKEPAKIELRNNGRNSIRFKRVAACLAIIFLFSIIIAALNSPAEKAIPSSGYSNCITCEGTGYNYYYFGGLLSKPCPVCEGSGVRQNDVISIPSVVSNIRVEQKFNLNTHSADNSLATKHDEDTTVMCTND